MHLKYAGWLFNRTFVNDNYPDLEVKFTRVLMLLFEGGIHGKLYDFYMYKMDLRHIDKLEFESNEPKPLELNHILQMLILFTICLFLSTVSFMCEKFVAK